MILNEKKGNLFVLDEKLYCDFKYTFDTSNIKIIEFENDIYINSIITTSKCGELKVLYKTNKPNYYVCF